ncbi:ExbD/TolR family protein [Halopseudomonas phragmitis]|uniref:Biopolymer transporter ExbD n=2 Tax=Pseudomonadaceae TaxID=135621 RepID=A0A1V0B6S7_9GAMM|nr:MULTISPECIES: biopolymer transporter ExbD [Pseudomonadaceae]AQZ95619.1 biopolymer transporter ExbD [Halopseudomonas phragmitis]PAU87264.1 biopolymer transporter ExbD [Pseudomonas sp. WN033]RHW22586.1 biopolymer transporter ExbD [Pseudomonas jilinensis]
MQFRRQRPEEVGVNLTPLIDVVFLLLIFFMVTTTFTRETQLKVDLPQAASGEPVEQDLQVIELTISAAGEVAVNEQVLANPSLDNLKRALQRESAGNTELPLVITADGQAPHQAVVTAMDAAGQLGFSRLRLTTSEMQSDGQP